MSMTPKEIARYLEYAEDNIELVVLTRTEYARLRHIEYVAKQLFTNEKVNTLREYLTNSHTYDRHI